MRGCGEPAPVVVVGEDDLHRALRDGRGDVLEGDHAHVGGQRHRRRVRRPRAMPAMPPAPGPPGTRGRRRAPGRPAARSPRVQAAFGSSRSGWSGERLAQRADRGDLLVGREHAALELDRAEAVAGRSCGRACATTPAGSSASPHSSGFGVRGARPTCRTGTRCTATAVPDRAAEQVAHRAAEQLALDVQAGDLERRRTPGPRARGQRSRSARAGPKHGRRPAPSRSGCSSFSAYTSRPDQMGAQRARAVPGGRCRRSVSPRPVIPSSVCSLHDGAQRPRLVHARPS